MSWLLAAHDLSSALAVVPLLVAVACQRQQARADPASWPLSAMPSLHRGCGHRALVAPRPPDTALLGLLAHHRQDRTGVGRWQ